MSQKIDCLTSLRFFAATCIVIGHGGSKAHFGYSIDLFDLRHGVSFFFVLSGFILSHTYANLKRPSIGDFLVARLARVWPACTITTCLAIALLVPVHDGWDALKATTNFLLLQAWIPVSTYHYSFNGVAWSISTECFFYGMFPLALPIVYRSPWRALAAAAFLLAGLVVIASQFDLPVDEGRPGVTAWGILYVFPPARLLEFLSGMVAYQLSARLGNTFKCRTLLQATGLEVSAVGIAITSVILCTALGVHALRPIAPQFSVWVQTAGAFAGLALMIGVFYHQRGLLSRLLSSRPLVYLGELSFSLYLVHQIVIRWIFAHYRDNANAHPALAYACYWSISLGIAIAVFHCIEKPCRSGIRARFSRQSA